MVNSFEMEGLMAQKRLVEFGKGKIRKEKGKLRNEEGDVERM